MRAIATIAATVLVALAGCGDSEDDAADIPVRPAITGPDVTDSSPERDRFIAAADAICRPLARAVAREFPAEGEFEGTDEVAASLEELLPEFETTLAGLSELEAPPGEGPLVAPFLEKYEQEIALIRDFDRPGAGTELGARIRLHRGMGESYGYRVCPL